VKGVMRMIMDDAQDIIQEAINEGLIETPTIQCFLYDEEGAFTTILIAT
jgi:hypothetical protein